MCIKYEKWKWECGLYAACEINKLDIYIGYGDRVHPIQRYYNNSHLNVYLNHACKSDDNLDTINFLISKGAQDFDQGLEAACSAGCIKIAELMVQYGAKYNDESLLSACKGKHIEMVEFLLQKYKYDINGQVNNQYVEMLHCNYFYETCRTGCMELVELLIKNGANMWNIGLRGACSGGHLGIVKMMIQNGATSIDDGLCSACHGYIDVKKNIDVVHYMLSLGASTYYRCISRVFYY